jgi:DNA-binding transcriptional LysR family regulator
VVDLRNIETFFWIASLGSFRLAADKLCTTQPAVSQRIAQLEDCLQVRLFERSATGVTLSIKGHELLVHARRMLDVRQDMLVAAHTPDTWAGVFHLGVAETLVHTWLVPLIEQVRTRYPAWVLEIEVETTRVLQQQLQARKIDLALMLGPADSRLDAVEHLPLSSYPLAWVARPGLHGPRRRLSLAEVAQQPIVTHPKGSLPHQAVSRLLEHTGLRGTPMHSCASVAMLTRMALLGMGSCVLAPHGLAAELGAGQLEVLDVCDAPLPALEFVAAWLRGPEDRAARAMAALAQAVAQQTPGSGAPPAAHQLL